MFVRANEDAAYFTEKAGGCYTNSASSYEKDDVILLDMLFWVLLGFMRVRKDCVAPV